MNIIQTKIICVESEIKLQHKLNEFLLDLAKEGGDLIDIKLSTTFTNDGLLWFTAMIIYESIDDEKKPIDPLKVESLPGTKGTIMVRAHG